MLSDSSALNRMDNNIYHKFQCIFCNICDWNEELANYLYCMNRFISMLVIYIVGWVPLHKPFWFTANKQVRENLDNVKWQNSTIHSSGVVATDLVPALRM